VRDDDAADSDDAADADGDDTVTMSRERTELWQNCL
jgi:hypothetical protein